MSRGDRAIGILIGLAVGIAIVAVFVFVFSEETIDEAPLEGSGGGIERTQDGGDAAR